eukprot:14758148-Alexandrium_andersonii.AAC.1
MAQTLRKKYWSLTSDVVEASRLRQASIWKGEGDKGMKADFGKSLAFLHASRGGAIVPLVRTTALE